MCLGTMTAVAQQAQPTALTEAGQKLEAGYAPLIPMPKSIALGQGSMTLGSRVVAATPELRPLARVVVKEILLLTGRELSVAEGGSIQPGDVRLEITPGPKGASRKGLNEDQSYVLEISDMARVRGGSYVAVAYGTVTLLQLLAREIEPTTLPRCVVKDEPASAYRGLLVDVARKPHSIATLESCIKLCRWYKIRYLQLHLADDQSFTFPSTAFPKLATKGFAYTLDELRGLEQFATERGVVIVPELDVPGHSGAIVNTMPELFSVQGGARSGWSVTLNFAKEDACRAIETIIGEMLDVFRATPFFHIGADESEFKGFDEDPFFQEAYLKHGLTNKPMTSRLNRTLADRPKMWIKPETHPMAYELFLRFVGRLNETVKRHGRQALIWEGFSPAGATKVPTDMIVMPYHMRNYPPHWLVEDGYSLINCCGNPLYVVKPPYPAVEAIYAWNVLRFDEATSAWKMPIVFPPSAPILGAQMCSWEQTEDKELPSLRQRLAAMSERLWNPGFNKGFDEFSTRLDRTDKKFTTLLDNEALKAPVPVRTGNAGK